jgi:multicomponent Na+:H+ antiporter subunit E
MRADGTVPAWLARGSLFLGLWIVLSGVGLGGFVVGVATAAAATWLSLRLLPPGGGAVRSARLVVYTLHFVGQSIAAGVDVARRAFDPRLPLSLGSVRYRPRFGSRTARSAFGTLMSLVPGTLPAGSEPSGTLVVHCLDVVQPVVSNLMEEEARIGRIVSAARDDG